MYTSQGIERHRVVIVVLYEVVRNFEIKFADELPLVLERKALLLAALNELPLHLQSLLERLSGLLVPFFLFRQLKPSIILNVGLTREWRGSPRCSFLRLESHFLKVLTEEFRLQDFLGFFQHADLSVQPAQIQN